MSTRKNVPRVCAFCDKPWWFHLMNRFERADDGHAFQPRKSDKKPHGQDKR
jgi:hypothetical protein